MKKIKKVAIIIAIISSSLMHAQAVRLSGLRNGKVNVSVNNHFKNCNEWRAAYESGTWNDDGVTNLKCGNIVITKGGDENKGGEKKNRILQYKMGENPYQKIKKVERSVSNNSNRRKNVIGKKSKNRIRKITAEKNE